MFNVNPHRIFFFAKRLTGIKHCVCVYKGNFLSTKKVFFIAFPYIIIIIISLRYIYFFMWLNGYGNHLYIILNIQIINIESSK